MSVQCLGLQGLISTGTLRHLCYKSTINYSKAVLWSHWIWRT